MRNEKTSAAAIKAVQNNIKCQTSLIAQVDELTDSLVVPEGTLSISKNGTYDVSKFAAAEVKVRYCIQSDTYDSDRPGGYNYGVASNALRIPEFIAAMPYLVLINGATFKARRQVVWATVWTNPRTGEKYVDMRYIDSDGYLARCSGTLSEGGLLTADTDACVFRLSQDERSDDPSEYVYYEIYAYQDYDTVYEEDL